MELHEISDEWVMTVAAGFLKWVKTTAQGKEFIVQEIGFDWVQGDPTKEYRLKDGFGRPGRALRSDSVYFLRGVVVNGEAVPPSMLEVGNKDLENCERCGVNCHATKTIRNPASDRLETLCNSCLVKDENPRIKDEGDSRGCESCTKISCGNHPMREARTA